MKKHERAQEVLRRLRKIYKRQADTFVQWSNPLELLIATVLSAQCTDKRVNIVTKKLFRKYKTSADYANASLRTLQTEIYSITFYKSKSRYLKGIGKMLIKQFHGTVPKTVSELIQLPGVAYKTAHLMTAKAFGQSTGIAVDTHVRRIAPRLGFTQHHNPEKIKADLQKLYKSPDYLDVNEFFIMHGRAICKPRSQCSDCPLNDICPFTRKKSGKNLQLMHN
ncbi:MAG TPA: endonuclease III [Patescibacteria group bacterium]|nr:endonuclease III [Patescibacteria group bacterium]